jgi:hypothetical protein
MLILVLLDQSTPFILFVLPHIELISVYDVFC